MNTFDKFLLTALVILLTLLLTVFLRSNQNRDFSSQQELINYNQQLIDLVTVQNQTIHSLEAVLKSSKKKLCNKVDGIVEKVTNGVDLKVISESNSNECQSEKWKLTNFELECENRYGLYLADLWRKSKQTWCVDSSKQSTLECYPYHQQHKKLDGRGPDLICEAKNFLIDFSKIQGEHSSSKPTLGRQYLQFESGSLQSTCSKTSEYNQRLFMPHHSLQMDNFQSDAKLPSDHIKVDTTTYLLARDEDCENAFHSTADFMNMYLVKRILNVDFGSTQVMLFDQHPDGPFIELIEKAFSPSHSVIRHSHYRGQKVLFSRLIFHLESPAGLIFPRVANPNPLQCYDASLFHAYRRHILESFQLLDVSPPPIPTVTLIMRHRSAHKNVGRVLANEQDVIDVIRSGNMMKANIVDMAKMSYGEQLKMIRNSNIIVGVHGAGLMFILFAAEEAILVEIHPSYRQDRHFRHASRMAGKLYMPMRSMQRETCHGTSDNVFVNREEFTRTLDGAVRLARSFDDGLSECGLICPSEILAIDGRLDPFYSRDHPKGKKLNLEFPCG